VEPRSSSFRVGDWLVEPHWNRIGRDGETVKLEPRVMRLLATLAAVPDRPLQRQELLDSVWPDTFVNEEALSRAISQLRRAFGDDAKAPRYLQTVHKAGYCLIAHVGDAADRQASPAPQLSPAPAQAQPPRRRRWLPAAAIPLLLLAGLGGLLLYRGFAPSLQPVALRTLVPLTSDLGREIDPAVSPNGSRVAYLASSGAGYDIFVRDVDGGAPLRLTGDRLAKGHLTWSPNGDRLAFVAADIAAEGDTAAIYVLPLTGGGARKLVDLPSWSFGLDWSPDGRTLAYADAARGEKPGTSSSTCKVERHGPSPGAPPRLGT
jgi:DNA-binding winged helix-turn-helix (wHTH) protein